MFHSSTTYPGLAGRGVRSLTRDRVRCIASVGCCADTELDFADDDVKIFLWTTWRSWQWKIWWYLVNRDQNENTCVLFCLMESARGYGEDFKNLTYFRSVVESIGSQAQQGFLTQCSFTSDGLSFSFLHQFKYFPIKKSTLKTKEFPKRSNFSCSRF